MPDHPPTEIGTTSAAKRDSHFERYITICSCAIGATSVAFLAFACSKGYTTPAEGFADELGALLGRAFWVALGFALLWRAIPRDKKRLAICCFVLIISGIAVYRSAMLFRDVSDVKKTAEAFSSILRSVGEGRQIAPDSMNGKRYGELTGVVALMTDWTRDLQTYGDTVYRELGECNLASIFSPEVLTQPDLLSRCQVDYQKAETILSRHEERIKEWFGEYSRRVESADLAETQKKRVLSEWNRTKDENLRTALEGIGVQRAFVCEGTKLLAFMKERQARCTYRDKKIVFQAKDDADTFGVFVGNLTRLSAQEASYFEGAQQEGAVKAKELEQLIKR